MTQNDSVVVRRIGRIDRSGVGGVLEAEGEAFGPRVRLATRLDREEAFETIVAHGPAMRGLLERAQCAARSDSPLVLEGEPGCGKRALAKLIHELSARRDMPFVRVDCAAHDGAHLEGELFGVRRGGEARARRDREGLVQTAHRGTLLLENLAEMPAVIQPKLQEFLAEGDFRPVGDRWGSRCADVRVIVSSTVPLERHAAAGRLRRALYDRLAVLVLGVPSLRERVEDIEPLIEHFAGALRDTGVDAGGAGRTTLAEGKALEIDGEARAWLRAYPWPGNVRELQNAVEYACTMGSLDRLRCEDLPESIRRHAGPGLTIDGGEQAPGVWPEARSTRDERERIARALVRNDADVERTARSLGMTRRALCYAMGRFGLDASGARPAKVRVPGERLRAALERRPSSA